MKRILLIIIVCSIQLINAQSQDLKRAKRFFEKTFYSEAIPLYENILLENSSFEVVKNLADCYYYTNDYPYAQRQYRVLLARFNKDLEEEYYFRYSQTLKATGNYEESNQVLKDYFISSNNIEALSKLEKENKELGNVSVLDNRFEIKNLAINTVNSEFGAVEQGESLIFSGVKTKHGLFDKVYKWNNEQYLELMKIPLININSSDSIVDYFSKELNTSMHESNPVFTKDGNTIYFTRNNYKKGRRGKNKDKVSNLQIFKAELVDNKWTNVVSLPFNSDDYSVEHPALSSDEKILYFASDMPGTLGSFDIFSVAINGEDYGVPINLGVKINTSKKEQFPFISKDSKLYFSSNGHAGFGSLDVFVSEIQSNEFSKPLNVGLPVNSGYDDFSFTIDSDNKEGYFSSNRIGGKGNDDIYQLKEIKPLLIEDCMQFIAGIITDVDTNLPLGNTLVRLQNGDKIEIEYFTTAKDGKFSFTVTCETAYFVLASKEDYTKDSKFFQLQKERKKTNDASMSLKSMEAIRKEEHFALEEKEKQHLVLLEQKKKEEVALVEKVKKDKQIAAEKAIVDAQNKKKEKLDNIIATEKDVVKDNGRLIVKTDPIYFDYDLWYIRRESKPILNRVIELMKKYPDMVIEIGSHTDNRGNNHYNLKLSSNRAQSTKEYFVSQGISSKRIIAKGYGESVQINKCEPSESCTEEQHELNRRSEFVIKNL
ncbi:OmpA family protein [Flavobacterium frigoris]|uniref:Outer membrane protein OmpA n=1 Tax=Flavobacterium frigoris TaxID=229204 RepID=A0A1H9R802_FLAFI|nr:OmpA family protein [Flavobacterium frigoris]SER68808.1 Outer membrane protein OmpA [Flavobacterium frigoris]